MIAKTIVDQVLDELRDTNGTAYSRTSILSKLKEALTQFTRESSMLKHTISYPILVGKSVYPLPEGTTNFSSDWDFATAGTGVADDTFTVAANGDKDFGPGTIVGVGSATAPTAFYKYLGSRRVQATSALQTVTLADAPSTALQVESIFLTGPVLNSTMWKVYYTPRYLKAIRFGLLSVAGTEDRVLTPNSKYERDVVGLNPLQTGTPNYIFNDEFSFFRFGIWPVPNAACVASYYSSIRLAYVCDADILTTENDTIDPGLPDQYLDKLYLLVCFLRLKASVNPEEAAKAPSYEALYKRDLLAPALSASAHIDRYDQLRVMS
jgi:hypothetical protein